MKNIQKMLCALFMGLMFVGSFGNLNAMKRKREFEPLTSKEAKQERKKNGCKRRKFQLEGQLAFNATDLLITAEQAVQMFGRAGMQIKHNTNLGLTEHDFQLYIYMLFREDSPLLSKKDKEYLGGFNRPQYVKTFQAYDKATIDKMLHERLGYEIPVEQDSEDGGAFDWDEPVSSFNSQEPVINSRNSIFSPELNRTVDQTGIGVSGQGDLANGNGGSESDSSDDESDDEGNKRKFEMPNNSKPKDFNGYNYEFVGDEDSQTFTGHWRKIPEWKQNKPKTVAPIESVTNPGEGLNLPRVSVVQEDLAAEFNKGYKTGQIEGRTDGIEEGQKIWLQRYEALKRSKKMKPLVVIINAGLGCFNTFRSATTFSKFCTVFTKVMTNPDLIKNMGQGTAKFITTGFSAGYIANAFFIIFFLRDLLKKRDSGSALKAGLTALFFITLSASLYRWA